MATHCPKCKAENHDTQSFCGDCSTQLNMSKDARVSFPKTIAKPVDDFIAEAPFAGGYQGQKFLDPWADVDLGIAEVEDSGKRLAGLRRYEG